MVILKQFLIKTEPLIYKNINTMYAELNKNKNKTKLQDENKLKNKWEKIKNTTKNSQKQNPGQKKNIRQHNNPNKYKQINKHEQN